MSAESVNAALAAYDAALAEHAAVIQRMRATSTEECTAEYLTTARANFEARSNLASEVRRATWWMQWPRS